MAVVRPEQQLQLNVVELGLLRLLLVAIDRYWINQLPERLIATTGEDDDGGSRNALGQVAGQKAQGALALFRQVFPWAWVQVDVQRDKCLDVLPGCLLV